MLKLNISQGAGFSLVEVAALNHACELANTALNSGDFAVKFLGAKLSATNGKSNFDILHMLLDHDVEVTVKYAGHSTSSAIAFEGGGVTYLYDQAFSSLGLLASNLVHEASHSLGFSHPYLPKRWFYPFGYDNSYVPYAFSSMIEPIVKNILAQKAAQTVTV